LYFGDRHRAVAEMAIHDVLNTSEKHGGSLLFERLAWPIFLVFNSVGSEVQFTCSWLVCIELDQTGQSLGFDYGVSLIFG
jgi:hypothetical protein